MTIKTLRLTALAAACALAFSACGDSSTDSASSEKTGTSQSAKADGKKLAVSVTLHPVNYLVKGIGGDQVEVTNLAKSAASPHDLELSAKDIAKLSKADVLFYLSGDLQPAVVKAAEGDAKKQAVDLAESADLSLRAGDVVTIGKKKDDHGHDDHDDDHKDEKKSDKKDDDHDHDHDHKDEKKSDKKDDDHDHDHKDEKKSDKKDDDHDHDDHGHHHDPNSADPHFWLDPVRMVSVAEAIEKKLSALNPDAADTYAKNLKDVVADLNQLDKSYKTGLKTCKHKKFVSNHTAFGYLAKRYNMTQVGIAGLHPEDEPSTKTLTLLAKYIKTNKVPTVYYETSASPKIAKTLAKETGAKTAILDPIATINKDSVADSYLGIMEANLKSLKTGQDCS